MTPKKDESGYLRYRGSLEPKDQNNNSDVKEQLLTDLPEDVPAAGDTVSIGHS
ncbi:hypothetical protein BIW11_02940 [Tropilaelaps mercedesae]|uniref:Uncharacterized protein n=1 Tax=Tropilaelaps mercedesae TaxID=418985 RepID=A0A1V9XUR1_9ACAR|nr:hypothetical protein BIW11_02940 [Tropilaelaps mercedesae]